MPQARRPRAAPARRESVPLRGEAATRGESAPRPSGVSRRAGLDNQASARRQGGAGGLNAAQDGLGFGLIRPHGLNQPFNVDRPSLPFNQVPALLRTLEHKPLTVSARDPTE